MKTFAYSHTTCQWQRIKPEPHTDTVLAIWARQPASWDIQLCQLTEDNLLWACGLFTSHRDKTLTCSTFWLRASVLSLESYRNTEESVVYFMCPPLLWSSTFPHCLAFWGPCRSLPTPTSLAFFSPAKPQITRFTRNRLLVSFPCSKPQFWG